MAGVRPFLAADIEPVAALSWKVMHGRQGPAPAALTRYFDELFLHNPWLDDGIKSQVCEDANGRIVGFFGAVPRRMNLQGKTIRIAFGSNFIMEPGSRTAMAAMQLVRAFLKGTQDISMTDSANESSRQLLRSLGFQIVPAYSLLWFRPLRVARYAFHGAARLKKSTTLKLINSVGKPLWSIIDMFAARGSLSPLCLNRPDTELAELDTATLLELLGKIPPRNWMLPEYNLASLDWVVNFVNSHKPYGPLCKRVVRKPDGKPLGWYIYGGSAGNVGEVLQVGAESSAIDKVLNTLFYDAFERGLIGLHGRVEPYMMQELTMKSCFFIRNGSWTLVHSDKVDLLNSFHSGAAFFSRLDGEWSLRPGNVE
jgi:hypothetical protein